jgi:hypothetical protein
MKKANMPLLISLEDDSWCLKDQRFCARCFLTNDGETQKGIVKITLSTVSEELLFKEFSGNWQSGTSEVCFFEEKLPVNMNGLLFVHLQFRTESGLLFENVRIYGVPDFKAAFRLPETSLRVSAVNHEQNLHTVVLLNDTPYTAVKVRAVLPDIEEKYVYWHDNYLTLLPGHEYRLQFETPDIPQQIRFSGWNVTEQLIKL